MWRRRHFISDDVPTCDPTRATLEAQAAPAENRARWVAACGEAYDKVYRGIVAMGRPPQMRRTRSRTRSSRRFAAACDPARCDEVALRLDHEMSTEVLLRLNGLT
jgi:hypothetical protein